MARYIILGLTLFVLGCDGPSLSVLPVTGTVTLDGQPVENASVTFIPTTKLPAGGVTDAAGKFTLKTIEGPYELNGAIPGKYKVVITKFNQNGILPDEQGLSGSAPSGIKVEWLIPQKYADKNTTELTCQVEPGMAPPKFELKSK